MIHQLIFASPKPGMSEHEFQEYWVKNHAINFASKIKQIKKYMIGTRIHNPENPDEIPHCGVAEITLNNEKEQIESLQSKEFLEGARLDEPNWAAFWQTVVLDADEHIIMKGEDIKRDMNRVKVYLWAKRKAGMPLDEFRKYSLSIHSEKVLAIPGLRRHVQSMTKDGFYSIGEALLDCVYQFWFDDVDSFKKAISSIEHNEVIADMSNFVELKYVKSFIARENWIIGPEPRN